MLIQITRTKIIIFMIENMLTCLMHLRCNWLSITQATEGNMKVLEVYDNECTFLTV